MLRSSKRYVLLAILIAAFIMGYWVQQYPSGNRSTVVISSTQTQFTTRTVVVTSIHSELIYSNTSLLQTQFAASTIIQSVISSNTTSSVFEYSKDLYLIPSSTLLSDLNISANVTLVASSSEVPYYVAYGDKSNSTIGLIYLTTDIAPASSWGFNAPIGTLVLLNASGFIKALSIYTIYDTYEDNTITQDWLNTYINRSVFERLQIGTDAIAVTGATFSSLGVVDGVRDAGRVVVNDYRHHIVETGIG